MKTPVHKAINKAKDGERKIHITHKTGPGMYKGDSATRIVPINGKFPKIRENDPDIK